METIAPVKLSDRKADVTENDGVTAACGVTSSLVTYWIKENENEEENMMVGLFHLSRHRVTWLTGDWREMFLSPS